ncbi:hypothetical protein D6T64_11280 [Cryobacterium melibiosiphilum]|uniref:Amidase domain-containing protein n=1 Tax=Cryobacterium melibiosiphilum TaxID=995039 RepID=A0A3A5MHA0_9MICO|nr:amidase family protein [Cryobacterium melibiosiphilum]RJT88221.1 hypothetical protein D6T64_11280 [Cryobacterium melibiosiphilum]
MTGPFDTSVWRVLGNPLVSGTTEPHGRLAGETIAVKDLYAVAGFAIGAGNPQYLREAAPEPSHAAALAALVGAGASVVGIAQTDEFAYSVAGVNAHYGTAPNPRVPGGLPGGSTSGPAAALALGHASIGLGTDTAGSIRVPASYQGLWGLRSTHGAVSRAGLLPLAPSFDTVGWLTGTPELLQRVAEVGLRATASLQVEAPARFAVAVPLIFAADEGAQAAFVDGLSLLERAGVLPAPEIIEVGDLTALFAAFRTVQAGEAWSAHGAWVRAHPGALGADVAARFDAASRVTPFQMTDARASLAAHRAALDAALEGRILLLPSTSSTAPDRGASAAEVDAARAATLSMTCLAAIGGYPAVSAPLLEVAGAPLGLGLVGPRHSDLALVDVAARFAATLAA